MSNSAINRLLIQLSIAGESLYPMLACALGLGEIQIDSRLNQPLRARIEIIDVSDEEWREVRTRLNWQESDAAAVHPELLDAITLRVAADAGHRHFIEVRSAGAMTEPLFDLPVEVARGTARVIRNYSVLLDPPTPGTEEATVAAAQPTPTIRQTPEAQVAASGSNPTPDIANRHKRHRHAIAHSAPVPTRIATARRKPAEQNAAQGSPRQELEKQLDALQQILAKMQETIAAQNAQIVDLTARIAARTQAPQSSGAGAGAGAVAPAPAQVNQTADGDEEETEPTAGNKPRAYFWGAALGLTAILAAVFAVRMRKRAAGAAARTSSAQGTRSADRTSPARAVEKEISTSVPPPARASSPTTTVEHAKQTEASDHVDVDWSRELWGNPDWLRILGDQAASNADADAAKHSPQTPEPQVNDPRPAANKEVAQILQDSLTSDPNRVDIRIKLLEIYHHEALGNRAEFNSLLDALMADSRMLTTAQRSHVEKLQRTLGNDTPDRASEFVTKVAI